MIIELAVPRQWTHFEARALVSERDSKPEATLFSRVLFIYINSFDAANDNLSQPIVTSFCI